MKTLIKLALIILTGTALAALPVRAADDATSTTNTAPPAAKKAKAGRFAGTIQSVDSSAMTLTLKKNGTIIKVTSSTKIYKDKQPGTFADATEGMHVTGSGAKEADGAITAHTLHISATAHKKAAAPAPAPSSSSTEQK